MKVLGTEPRNTADAKPLANFDRRFSIQLMEILYVFLGWLLGLLAQPISSWIERWYKRKDFRLAIFSELKNLAVRLNMIFFKIQKHLGTLSKESLQLILDTYKTYDADSNQTTLFSSAEEMLKTPDQEFAVEMNKFKAPDNMSLGLKTFSLYFIDSALGNISVFNSEFQHKILEIRAQIDMLNQEIENSKDYFNFTFNPDSLSANQNILRNNIKASASPTNIS